jgi:hypothetical protein
MIDEQYKQLRDDLDEINWTWLFVFSTFLFQFDVNAWTVAKAAVLAVVTRKIAKLVTWGWREVRTRVRKTRKMPPKPNIPRPSGEPFWSDDQWMVWACTVCDKKGSGLKCWDDIGDGPCGGQMACRPARLEDMPRA